MAQIISLLLLPSLVGAWTTDKENLKDYANMVASNEKISVSLLEGIITAESGWQKDAHNPVGTASGVLQFLDSTFKTYCIDKYGMAKDLSQKNNPFIQINCAVEMLKEPYGWRNWESSWAFWKNKVNV